MGYTTNKDIMFQAFTLNDVSVVELLIQYRYKYDENLFLEGSMYHVTGTKAINQELVATFVSLDETIKHCKFTELQLKVIKMTEEGYTHQEIADETGVEQGNVARTLKTIYKSIVKENERQWRKVIYISKLDLKTKQCSKCEENLPATYEFYREDKRSKDGCQSRCRQCEKR